MTEMLSTRDMTVRSVIGSRGQTFALERPVPVRAGQRVYYGIRFDGRPLVSVASDTPIFDRAELDTLNPEAAAIADVADLICRALESNGRQIDLTRGPGNNNLLIPQQRGI